MGCVFENNRVNSFSQGHVTMSGDIFGCHDWVEGTAGIQWPEARAAVMHPTVDRAAPTMEDCQAPG